MSEITNNLKYEDSKFSIENAILDISGATYSLCQSPEWIKVLVDSQERIIAGVRTDGSMHINKIEGVTDAIEEIREALGVLEEKSEGIATSFIDNQEFISVETDSEGKVLGGRKSDGTRFENLNIDIQGNEISTIDDSNLVKVETDNDGRIISCKSKEGILYEPIGIDTKYINCESLNISSVGAEKLNEILNDNKPYKYPDLPKYGTVNILTETFYLTPNAGYSDINGVYIIRDYPDTAQNAASHITLDYYYVKSSLQDNGDGTYSKYGDGVEGHDIKLNFYAAAKVTKIGSQYYVTSTLEDGQVVPESIEVTQVTGVPDVHAWPVNKKTEHYCTVNINFGSYMSGTYYIGIKFQGSSTLDYRKKNFRFTFYKNTPKPYYPIGDDKFGKKNKVKIGEMVRLSGFNLKANWTDPTRIKEVTLNRFFNDIWEDRDTYAKYPWNTDFTPYTQATGLIKGFPISVYIGGEFYGLHVFGLKKDGKNYMLKDTDGETPATGLLVCGNGGTWSNEEMAFIDSWQPNPEYWDEELNDDEFCTVNGHTAEDSTALTTFLTWVNSDDFTKESAPEKMDVLNWIDYFILMQVFIMYDNTSRNVIMYSNAERTKFWPFFYDLDQAWRPDATARTAIAIDADILAPGVSFCSDMTMWDKLWDLFKDEIVTRYKHLRETVLSAEHIKIITDDLIKYIPTEEEAKETTKWGSAVSAKGISRNIFFLQKRLEWLDKNYFKY